LLAFGLPPGFIGGDWPCRFSFEAGDAFDGLIIADAAAAGEAARLLRERRAWLAPVVDLTGRNLEIADFSAEAATRASLRKGVEQALNILIALRRLPASVLVADDPETLLLARVYSRDGRLEPIYDGATPQLLRYPRCPLESPVEIAERLTEAGWLSRTFFDRLHFCPTCQSSRLNAREECSACRSPDVREESIINHFRCAHQATERQFSQGDRLICPKCRRQLRHFGVDYDRPGSATVCRACGQVDADPAIGFLCVDCGARNDAAVVPTRSWYAYALTKLGERRLLNGDLRTLRSSGGDESTTFRALLDHWMHIQARYRRPVAMLSLAFTRAREVQNRQGARALSLATKQAVEIVRGELRASDFMVEIGDGLLIVMPENPCEPR
jgi:Thaumarchaeal output domain 1